LDDSILATEAIMKPKVIVIDGRTYNSVNDMPQEVRQKYEQAMRSLQDANNNRVPDAFESLASDPISILADKNKDGVPDVLENLTTGQTILQSMKIIVDGKEYDGLETLPPEARARYEEAMGKLDANRNGIPDFTEGMLGSPSQNVMSASSVPAQAESPRRSAPIVTGSSLAPDTSNGLMLALAGLFFIALCVAGAGAIWYFFLR
jgi:hypothetical protein